MKVLVGVLGLFSQSCVRFRRKALQKLRFSARPEDKGRDTNVLDLQSSFDLAAQAAPALLVPVETAIPPEAVYSPYTHHLS